MKIIAPKRLMESVFPTVRNGGIFNASSLDLQFARTKTLDPRVTFTRVSSGTFVGSDGLIKTATTNLLSYSEEFNESVWTKHNLLAFGSGSTVNATTAPNGNLTADKITENTSNAQHMLYRNATPEAGKSYVLSFYAKAAERTFVIGGFSGGGLTSDCTVGVNLSTGDVASTSGSPELTQATAVGGGWYRIALVKTLPSTSVVQPRIIISTNGTSQGYTGDGTSGIYIWGAQLEQSSTVGEYIPTTSTINSAPRFDHNPTTGESLGLLVEEARTNLLLQSENFGTTWTTNGLLAFGSGSTLNALTAPDGQTTADLITENTSNSQHNVNQTSTTTGAKRFSVFAKQGPGARLLRLIDFNATDGAQGETYFNLSTGAVVSGPGTIQALSNGWYRCSIQSTTTVTSKYFISIATSALEFIYTGDGTSGIYIWGAQLEAGSFPTSYIPTTTATVTRSADVASISGSNFSSWYRQDEGTIYAEGSVPVGVSGSRALAGISDGTNSERIIISHNGTTAANGLVVDGNTSQTSFTVTANSFPPGERKKVALAYKVDDFGFTTVPGTTVEQDSSGTLPTVDRLQIGNAPGRTEPNQPIRRLTYWPARLPNSTLQTITQ